MVTSLRENRSGSSALGKIFLLGAVVGLWLMGMLGFPRPAAAVDPAKGMLLVADTRLDHPLFRQSVILLVKHDAEGSLGVILNRPSELPIAEAFPGITSFTGREEAVNIGGPVSPRTILVLLRSPHPPQHGNPVAENLHITSLGELASRIDRPELKEDAFRVFIGYAGWVPGQLEAEIRRGDWTVLPGTAPLMFETPMKSMWQRAWGLTHSLTI